MKKTRNFANMYWTSKLHKDPSKVRFIIVAPQCSMKTLSETINIALKLLSK